MSSCVDLLREEHLNQTCHMLLCLKKCHNSELVFDNSDHVVYGNELERRHWTSSEFSHILKEGVELPANMTQAR